MIISKVRRVGPNSLGITLPNEVLLKFSIQEGDLLLIKDFSIEKSIISYRCGVCGYDFTEDKDEKELTCQSCGEKEHFINLDE